MDKKVTGDPLILSFYGSVGEWFIPMLLKSIDRDERSVGSNPATSADLILPLFIDRMWNNQGKKICPICGREITAPNFKRHLGWHARVEEHKKNLVGRIGVGKASTEEKEILRRQKISETMKKNPKAGGLRKGSGRGKKCWYESPVAGRVYLRSTYELEYCKYLDEKGIRWKQNLEGFEYEFKGKVHRYFPDFILLDENCYIEIKGFKRENDEAKWKSFPHKLQILYYNDLQKMGINVKGNFTEHLEGNPGR